MQGKGQWHWEFSNKYGRFSGYLDAVDPRDAVSRVLTQSVVFSGLLFGQEYGVPIDVIANTPGSSECLNFEAVQDDYALRVQRLSIPI
jgi:hypothetical protein